MLEKIELIKFEKRQALLIMKMSKLFRTPDDIIFLARYFKDLKAFAAVSELMMSHLCAIMTCVEYEADHTGFVASV
jgi:hypothetical protein